MSRGWRWGLTLWAALSIVALLWVFDAFYHGGLSGGTEQCQLSGVAGGPAC